MSSTNSLAAAAPRRLALNFGLRDVGTLLGLIVIVAVFAALTPNFLTERNLVNILQQSSINACVALGMTLVIIAGGIDLSVGPTAAIAAVAAAVLMAAGAPIAVAIACLWLPWARIDRATFQYHIFTTLPFTFLALAYFLAELWHGPSRGTWALARIGAAIAVIGAPLLWLLRQPLCGLANTQSVNPNTEVCAGLSRALVLTDIQAIGVAITVGGLIAAGLALTVSDRATGYRPLLIPLSFAAALVGAMTVLLGSNGKPFFQITVQAEYPALAALILLAVPAYFVLRASDPRKFVVGALTAAAIWFVAFYPNIASLPVPTPLSQVHLGLLPTWNWGFQFGVNRDPAANVAISWPGVILLAVAVVGLCIAAVYAARTWRSARYADDEVSELSETS